MITDNHHIHLHCGRYAAHHDYCSDGDIVFSAPRLAYVIKGTCNMRAINGQELSISEGDVWFLPNNVPYRSAWRADGRVEFVFVEFDVDLTSLQYRRFQRMASPDALPMFERIYSYYSDGNTIAALSTLFDLLNRFLPLLEGTDTADHDRLAPALNYLHANYTEKVKVGALARLCSLSEAHFYVLFRSATGQTPIEYKNSLKISHAIRLLEHGDTLESICDSLGFASPAFLRKMIRRQTGMLPKDVKKNKIKM